MRSPTARLTVGAGWVLLGLLGVAHASSIVNTPHNLSMSGPGPIKSPTETQVCIFCHTPHNADPSAPLWNRAPKVSEEIAAIPLGYFGSAANHQMPWSPTMKAYPSPGAAPQPDGSSKLCLTCHDGTIALGGVRSRTTEIPVSGGPRLHPGQKGYLGTDLSGSHPISFVYDDALAAAHNAAGNMPLRLPSTLLDPDVKLDSRGKIQCTTCHDPHNDRNYGGPGVPHFYAKPTWSSLCLTCHDY